MTAGGASWPSLIIEQARRPSATYRAVLKPYLDVKVWRGAGVLSWQATGLLSLRLLAGDASNHLLQQTHTPE